MLITHDMGVIAETADRVAVMYAGRIVEIGPVREVIHAPRHPYTVGLMGSIPKIGAAATQTPRADRRRNAAPERDPARLRLQPALPQALRALLHRASGACCRPERARPPAGCMRRSLAGPGRLIEVSRDFDVSRPWLNRVIERAPRQMLRAVDGVDLRGRARRDARAGRRIGLRQVHRRAPHRRPLCAAGRSGAASTACRAPRAGACR